ncbi:hypothetical protein PYCC9005_004343 [Savitreella phatthalungensis]
MDMHETSMEVDDISAIGRPDASADSTFAAGGITSDPRTQQQVDADIAELRRLVSEHQSTDLHALAPLVRANEATKESERYRNLYAHQWLALECELAPDVAVPRNRMYGAYVDLCARERLRPVNSAGFGRLVRLVYPDVKTRRLGIRGESKYHYCGVRCKGDNTGERTANQTSVRQSKKSALANGSGTSTGGGGDMFGGGLMNTNSLMRNLQRDMQQQKPSAGLPVSSMDFSSFIRPTTRLVYPGPELAAELDESIPFELPQIYDYLPDDADADAQDALVASYYMHCVNLIEAIASMRVRQFMQLNATFYHGLPQEVQQLLGAPSLATWIQKADLHTYQHMTRILSPLTTQVIPPEVFGLLKNLSVTLLPNIHQSVSEHAPHLLQAKLVPAGQFASLLSRMLRVNETAHAAARFLTNPADRELMRMDWLRYVDPKQVANRELACGESEVVNILNGVLNLLGPTTKSATTFSRAPGTPHHPPNSPTPQLSQPNKSPSTNGIDITLHEPAPPTTLDAAMHAADTGPEDAVVRSSSSSRQPEHLPHEPVLDAWTRYLSTLPHKFPAIEPRLFLLCMGTISSSVLREITVSGGEGFGALWVVRCWVDEHMRWLCERAGFLLEQVYDTFDDDDEDEDDLAFDGNNIDLDDFLYAKLTADALPLTHTLGPEEEEEEVDEDDDDDDSEHHRSLEHVYTAGGSAFQPALAGLGGLETLAGNRSSSSTAANGWLNYPSS